MKKVSESEDYASIYAEVKAAIISGESSGLFGVHEPRRILMKSEGERTLDNPTLSKRFLTQGQKEATFGLQNIWVAH